MLHGVKEEEETMVSTYANGCTHKCLRAGGRRWTSTHQESLPTSLLRSACPVVPTIKDEARDEVRYRHSPIASYAATLMASVAVKRIVFRPYMPPSLFAVLVCVCVYSSLIVPRLSPPASLSMIAQKRAGAFRLLPHFLPAPKPTCPPHPPSSVLFTIPDTFARPRLCPLCTYYPPAHI